MGGEWGSGDRTLRLDYDNRSGSPWIAHRQGEKCLKGGQELSIGGSQRGQRAVRSRKFPGGKAASG